MSDWSNKFDKNEEENTEGALPPEDQEPFWLYRLWGA